MFDNLSLFVGFIVGAVLMAVWITFLDKDKTRS
jgi:hypothetical protein